MSGTSSVPPEPSQASVSDVDRKRHNRLSVVLVVVSVVFALAVVALLMRVLTPVSDASPSSTTAATSAPATSAPGTSTPSESTPTASATPTPTSGTTLLAVPRPASCQDLYSPALVADFGGLALNPAWTQQPGVDVMTGSDDPALQAIIDSNEHLTCIWASPVGGSGTGLTTNVVWVSAETSVTVESRLRELGMDCYAESGGLRCVTLTTTEEGLFGESHFVRNGIWLATKFTNFNPAGYTPALVAALWPEG